MRQEKFQQKRWGKTNNCNIEEDEAPAGIVKKCKSTFLFF